METGSSKMVTILFTPPKEPCSLVASNATVRTSLASQTFRWGERLVTHVNIHVVLEFEQFQKKSRAFQSLHHMSRACKVVVV